MDVGVDQARDKVRPVEIPLVETPVRAADPDNRAGFYREIVLLPCAGKSIEDLCIPVHHVRRLKAACCRDKVCIGVCHVRHTAISRMTAASRCPPVVR